MSIITKGLGANQKLITQGYGLAGIVGPGIDYYKSALEALYLTGYLGEVWTAYSSLSESVSTSDYRESNVGKGIGQPLILSDYYNRTIQFYRQWYEDLDLRHYLNTYKALLVNLIESLILFDVSFDWGWTLSKYITVYLKQTLVSVPMGETALDVYTKVQEAVVNLKETITNIYTKYTGDD